MRCFPVRWLPRFTQPARVGVLCKLEERASPNRNRVALVRRPFYLVAIQQIHFQYQLFFRSLPLQKISLGLRYGFRNLSKSRARRLEAQPARTPNHWPIGKQVCSASLLAWARKLRRYSAWMRNGMRRSCRKSFVGAQIGRSCERLRRSQADSQSLLPLKNT